MFPKNTLTWQDAEPNVALYRYGAAGEELGKGSRYSTTEGAQLVDNIC